MDTWLAGQSHRESALLSTIVTDDGVERKPAKLTTPEPLDLQKHLFHAVSAGADYLTMEVSSQALKYGRVIGVELTCAVFLNIGEDHISPVEHPNLEDYLNSKLLIFKQAKNACVNLDCDHVEQVRAAAEQCPRVVTFSQKFPSADVYGSNVRKEGDKIAFHVRTPRYEGELAISTPGLFNVENALAARGGGGGVRYPPGGGVAEGLVSAFVPGRMEHYASRDGQISVIVGLLPQRHEPAERPALRQAEYPGRELTVMFGCTGGKGIDRREGMGSAAGGVGRPGSSSPRTTPAPRRWRPSAPTSGCSCPPTARATPSSPTGRWRWSRPSWGPAARRWCCWRARAARPPRSGRTGPEPCIPDGQLAQRVLDKYDAG